MNDRERALHEELTRIADEAHLRPGVFEAALRRAQRRRRVAATATAAALIAVVLMATVLLPDSPRVVQEPVGPEEERTHSQLEIETETIDLGDQPLALDISHGSVWATTGMRRELLEIRDGRVTNRYDGGGVGLAISGRTAWLAAGGDGAEPDGSLTGIDLDSGAIVQRVDFPAESPYGVDVGRGGVFVALTQGNLARLHPGGDEYMRIPLANGIRDVLVAHDAVWVSQPQGLNPRVWRVTATDDDSNAAPLLLTPQGKGSCPGGLAATSDAVWVADPCAAVLWKLDPSGRVVDRIDDVGNKPVDVAAGPRFLYVSSFRGDEIVTLVDRTTETVVAQVDAGEGPSSIVADGEDAWVANSEGSSLTRIHVLPDEQAPADKCSRYPPPFEAGYLPEGFSPKLREGAGLFKGTDYRTDGLVGHYLGSNEGVHINFQIQGGPLPYVPADPVPVNVLGSTGSLGRIEEGFAVEFRHAGCAFRMDVYGISRPETVLVARGLRPRI